LTDGDPRWIFGNGDAGKYLIVQLSSPPTSELLLDQLCFGSRSELFLTFLRRLALVDRLPRSDQTRQSSAKAN
jgi:hypothetical protein